MQLPLEEFDRQAFKILVVGGSGFLGRGLRHALGPERAVATFHSHPFERGIRFDLASDDPRVLLKAAEGVTHAVILAGISSPDTCARNPQYSEEVNVTRTALLVEALVAAGVVPIFASTSSVFNGLTGNYSEEDSPAPLMRYAAQKLAIEELLQRLPSPHLTLRVSRVFSSEPADGTFITQWVQALRTNADITCAVDQRIDPLHLDEFVEAVVRLILAGASGCYHVANPKHYSRKEALGLLLNAYWRYRSYTGRIIERRLAELPTLEPRPLAPTLNPLKLLSQTDILIAPLEVWCERITASLLYDPS